MNKNTVTSEEVKENLNFGEAIEALKKGEKVARKGWNGKGMFLWLKQEVSIKAEWCKDPELKTIVEENGGSIRGLGTICMLTAKKEVLTGWSPNQLDILSDDWMIL